MSKKSPFIRLVPVEDEIGGQAAAQARADGRAIVAAGFAREPEAARALDMDFDLVAGAQFQRFATAAGMRMARLAPHLATRTAESSGYTSSEKSIRAAEASMRGAPEPRTISHFAAR